jgi:peptide/nickel transport system permease protein
MAKGGFMSAAVHEGGGLAGRLKHGAGAILPHLGKLAMLLFVVSTLLFFLLRQAGDPAYVLAGAGASPEQLALIREQYGLNEPLFQQYLSYLWNVLHLNFGASLQTNEPALMMVLARFPATLHLTVMAMLLSIFIAVPVGAWIGAKPERAERRFVSGLIFILQGSPGFVFALLLIQLFAVQLMWLPSMGYEGKDWTSWILPTLSLATFCAPSLIRMVAANVAEAMREDYIRTARAYGAGFQTMLWRHALPNALLGASALLGVQFAGLLSGSAVIETIYAWPGLGWLLLESVTNLDFPVVQALAFLIAILVFAVNFLTDLFFRFLDPRTR